MFAIRENIYAGLLLATVSVVCSDQSEKIERKLVASFSDKKVANVFVKFKNGIQPALQSSSALVSHHQSLEASRGQKISHLVNNLKSLSQSSQRTAMNIFQTRSSLNSFSSFEQIWATNELYIKGANEDLVNQLAALPEVTEIHEEKIFVLDHKFEFQQSSPDVLPFNTSRRSTVQWNVDKIEAPKAWKLKDGNNGEGVDVANIDTGVRHTHRVLKDNFRREYGWFDATSESDSPSDEHGHGTHCMGTLAGSWGIGVAPGAKWIACKAIDNDGIATESMLKACGQWILCPTLPNGETPNCDMAPHVVSNSWVIGENGNSFNDIIEAWKAANIIPVFGIGNDGPYCGSARSPADQDVIAVGATTYCDALAFFSSAGPSYSGLIKPDITAPGHLIISAGARNDKDFRIKSGTSMATPHVAGVVALLLSRKPNLTYVEVKKILESSTDRNLDSTNMFCGEVNSTTFPNNQYVRQFKSRSWASECFEGSSNTYHQLIVYSNYIQALSSNKQ